MAVYVLVVKFIYSEKAKKFCKIFTLLLSYVVSVKSKMKISQNFVAFSEYMNFKIGCCWMKEEDIPRLHLHISERAVANHNSYDLISGKNVLGPNMYQQSLQDRADTELRKQGLVTLLKFRYSEKTTKICPHLPLFIWHYLLASNHEWKMG